MLSNRAWIAAGLGVWAGLGISCGSPAPSGPGVRGTDPNALAQNGAQPGAPQGTRSYENGRVGVDFLYPSAWRLTEVTPSSVSLDNAQLADAQHATQISFELLSQVAGVAPVTQLSLLKAVQAEQPGVVWRSTILGNKWGYFTQSAPVGGASETAEYDLLGGAGDGSVVRIRYSDYAEFDGQRTVDGILKGMVADSVPPIIDAIYFSPAFAQPGQTVKLVVEAHDDRTGIDLCSFGKSMGYAGSGGIIGYRVAQGNPLHDAYGIPVCGFTAALSGRFEMPFTVPMNGPLGTIQLVSIGVSDMNGNVRQLRIDNFSGTGQDDSFYEEPENHTGTFVKIPGAFLLISKAH